MTDQIISVITEGFGVTNKDLNPGAHEGKAEAKSDGRDDVLRIFSLRRDDHIGDEGGQGEEKEDGSECQDNADIHAHVAHREEVIQIRAGHAAGVSGAGEPLNAPVIIPNQGGRALNGRVIYAIKGKDEVKEQARRGKSATH